MDAASWAEHVELLKEQVLPQLLSVITGSTERALVKKGIEVFYSLAQNSLFASPVQGQNDEFVAKQVAQLASECSRERRGIGEFGCRRIECLCEWKHLPI